MGAVLAVLAVVVSCLVTAVLCSVRFVCSFVGGHGSLVLFVFFVLSAVGRGSLVGHKWLHERSH